MFQSFKAMLPFLSLSLLLSQCRVSEIEIHTILDVTCNALVSKLMDYFTIYSTLELRRADLL